MAATRALTVIRLDDGRELGFAEFGDPNGTPVFAFHGTPGSHRMFALMHDAALRLGVRLIAPDRPGYGASDYVPDRRLRDWPRDVAAVADFLGIARFGVMGVSGGGPHTAACAHALAPRLLGCAIVCGIAETLSDADRAGMMPANRLLSRAARRSPLLVRPLFALLVAGMRHFGEAYGRQMLKQVPAPDRRIMERPEVRAGFIDDGRRASRTTAAATAQDFALFTRPWGFRLEDIATRVDVFCGELDVNVPVSHGRRQADRIPDAKLHHFPEEAHLLVFDHAEEVLLAAAGRA
jgi:pimeloyl-ACP methyl ester carboxylesterase